jgi:hypothetical protein
MEKDGDSVGETSTEIASTWNDSQEALLKAISERANCMRWLHSQCQTHFEYMNFYLTIPNVIISTLNGSFTMSLNSLFPDPESQKYATTIIGLVSIFSAVLITMNQYVKSQQMMEAHRAAALAYGKMHRTISNELAMRRDQRSNAFEFSKLIRSEQDRLENMSPNILPNIITKFNRVFADRQIEKPEIAGDLDAVNVNTDRHDGGRNRDRNDRNIIVRARRSPPDTKQSPIARTMHVIKSASELLFPAHHGSRIAPHKETDLEEAMINAQRVESEDHLAITPAAHPAPLRLPPIGAQAIRRGGSPPQEREPPV